RRDLLDPHRLREHARSAATPVRASKQALQHGRALLHEFHLAGGSPAVEVAHYTWLVDRLLEVAWEVTARDFPGRAGAALVAVGGYGRGELHPSSGTDVLVLLPSRVNDQTAEFAGHLV